MGLDTLNSPDRRGWQETLDTAHSDKIPERAMRIAAEVNASPRALSDVETAGLVLKATSIKNEHASLMDKISKSDDAGEIATNSAEARRVEEEFDLLTRALRTSGTEKGRALASQKLTINQDYQLVSVKNRAKASKGSALSVAESAKLEQLTKDLEATNARVAELELKMKEQTASQTVRRNRAQRSGENRISKDAELNDLYSKARELLRAGCHDN